MVSQHALWLYNILHSGRLGVDRSRGHEIVMKQCDGDDDDREAAGNNSLTPVLSNSPGWLSLPSLQSKTCCSSLLLSFCMMQPLVLPLFPFLLLFCRLSCTHPQTLPSSYRFPISICQDIFHLTHPCLQHSIQHFSSPFILPLSGDLLSISTRVLGRGLSCG